MPFIRGKAGERGRQRWRAGCRHCEVIDAYQAARDAWEARRWSGEDAGGKVAGTANSGVGYYQLSDDEYRQIFPMPLFRDYLIQMRREREDEQEWREREEGEPTDSAWGSPDPWTTEQRER